MMRRRRTVRFVTLAASVVAITAPSSLLSAAGQPDPDGDTEPADVKGRYSDYILDIDATILDIEQTIVDLGAGTRQTHVEKQDKQTKTETEEIMVTLDASVFFDTDQHVLRPDAQATLRDVAKQIRADGGSTISVAGHTDSRGSDSYNQALSERRANSVRQALAAQLGGATIAATGYGESRPIASNETPDHQPYPEGMALNRRVEITYTATR